MFSVKRANTNFRKAHEHSCGGHKSPTFRDRCDLKSCYRVSTCTLRWVQLSPTAFAATPIFPNHTTSNVSTPCQRIEIAIKTRSLLRTSPFHYQSQSNHFPQAVPNRRSESSCVDRNQLNFFPIRPICLLSTYNPYFFVATLSMFRTISYFAKFSNLIN